MSEMEARARETAQWQVLAFHARSFRWASAFLNEEQRRKVAALYAFCRTVDDLADQPGSRPEAHRDLERLEAALEAEPGAEALWPESYLWFRALCVESGIDFRVVRDLLRGMSSDLREVRLQNDRELLRYCYRAAGTVGLMMCAVLGVRDRRSCRYAVDLGIAMQLTNISRDVLEDARACRVYLPADRLALYGVDPEDLVHAKADPEAVSLVVSEVLDIAEDYYRSADAGMRFLPPRARWAVLVASRLYRGIGRRLRRRYQSNPLLGRVVVPWFEKLGLVASATLSWLRLSIWPPRLRNLDVTDDDPSALPYADTDTAAVAVADADTDSDGVPVPVPDAATATDTVPDSDVGSKRDAVSVVSVRETTLEQTH
ncbi:MAG: phytoene/squalene synthase family protein [Myxococcales bacterium]|jgi:phytoene synthase